MRVDPDPLGTGRDPEFLRRITPLLETYIKWWRPTVRGFDRLPPRGQPFLVVGNHSGGSISPDLPILLTNWWRERDYEEPVYSLFFSAFMAIPGVGSTMARAGAIEADPGSAQRALEAGAPVVVYPGGDYDVLRPSSQRDRIDFGGRTGFVKLALRAGVPIVPVVSCGVHDSVIVLTRGEMLAKLNPLAGLIRAKIMPIQLGAPTGISLGWPTLPLPTSSIVELGEPMELGYPPEAADDPGIVQNIYDKVTSTMQATMDALAEERRG